MVPPGSQDRCPYRGSLWRLPCGCHSSIEVESRRQGNHGVFWPGLKQWGPETFFLSHLSPSQLAFSYVSSRIPCGCFNLWLARSGRCTLRGPHTGHQLPRLSVPDLMAKVELEGDSMPKEGSNKSPLPDTHEQYQDTKISRYQD